MILLIYYGIYVWNSQKNVLVIFLGMNLLLNVSVFDWITHFTISSGDALGVTADVVSGMTNGWLETSSRLYTEQVLL